MSQSALTIRLDSDLKKEFDSLCEEFGMSANTAFNIYVRQVVRNKSIPFTIGAAATDETMTKALEAFYRLRKDAAGSGLSDMPLDEINNEIKLARKDK